MRVLERSIKLTRGEQELVIAMITLKPSSSSKLAWLLPSVMPTALAKARNLWRSTTILGLSPCASKSCSLSVAGYSEQDLTGSNHSNAMAKSKYD